MGEDDITFDSEQDRLTELNDTLDSVEKRVQRLQTVTSTPKQNGKSSTTWTDLDPVRAGDWVDAVRIIGLDFETWGSRPLPKVGLDNYLADPGFTPLIGHIAQRAGRDAGGVRSEGYDFVEHGPGSSVREEFRTRIANAEVIVAHHVTVERRVLSKMGIDTEHIQFIDSAMISRAMGAAAALANAAPQLLDTVKLASGKRLIQKFSVPNDQYGGLPPTWDEVRHDPDWIEYNKYCGVDAQLALRIALTYGSRLLGKEYAYEHLTQEMNDVGWTVDRTSTELMLWRYEQNKEQALDWFRIRYDLDEELNLNSLKQLKEWCLDRGVKAKSFDEEHVDGMLGKVESRLATMPSLQSLKRAELIAVRDLLRTKQILGGSSLKKLPVIERTTGEDGQLRDQYMHVGAGQSYRTTGKGVQMQNLKRLHSPLLMADLDSSLPWSNHQLAENMRQLFTARDPGGALVVGDFSSVESRGLAYLAGEEWKLRAYRSGKDLYKELAAGIYSVGYDQVTKDQRQTGKVGELSCGYGAGAGAVQSFAAKMGVDFVEGEAAKLVRDWRGINPTIVDMWNRLGGALTEVVQTPYKMGHAVGNVQLANGMAVVFAVTDTPDSLQRQHPGAKTVSMTLTSNGVPYLRRYFHGCYMRGRDVCYYKPTDRVGGDLWSSKYVDPKTKQTVFYKLYGGKLAGILTQSFCREIFFHVMLNLSRWTKETPGVTLVGQFHDEIVMDYDPTSAGSRSLDDVTRVMEAYMADSSILPFRGFPLGAEVHSDYRYIK